MSELKIGDVVMVPATVHDVYNGRIYLRHEGVPGNYGYTLDEVAAWNRRASGWQPIETARGRKEILLYFPEDGSMDVMSWGQHPSGDYCFMNACLDRGTGATHWMPLPDPPIKSKVKSPTKSQVKSQVKTGEEE